MSMFVMVYPGKRYGVYISYEGEDNGEFIVYNKETNRDIIVIDGLTEYEVYRLRDVLNNVKDIDYWVNTTFEMDKPINGKHAQEYHLFCSNELAWVHGYCVIYDYHNTTP